MVTFEQIKDRQSVFHEEMLWEVMAMDEEAKKDPVYHKFVHNGGAWEVMEDLLVSKLDYLDWDDSKDPFLVEQLEEDQFSMLQKWIYEEYLNKILQS